MMGQQIIAAWTDVFTSEKLMGNELWRWLGFFGLLLGGLVAGRTVSYFLDRRAERLRRAEKADLLATFLSSLSGPLTLVPIAAALYVGGMFLNIQKTVTEGQGPDAVEKIVLVRLMMVPFWISLCKTVTVLAGGWFIFKLVDILEHFLSKWTSRTETKLDDQLVPLIRKALRVFIVIIAGLFIAQNIFDWDIGALIAGLGLGGLAFALAAKDALSNLFGSVMIFSDRPFQLGERIKIGAHDGIVEEVGFRSTRIRTLMGHQVIIPNAVVANEAVENIGRRPYLKRVLDITVTYDTSPEKLQRGVEILSEMCQARKEHCDPDNPARVFFTDFNADSLNIRVYYWFTPPDWWQYLEFNHDFNMELLRRFNAEGIEFAFPTRTLYVKQDSPFSAELNPSHSP